MLNKTTGSRRTLAVMMVICLALLAGCGPARHGGAALALTGNGAAPGGSILDALPQEEDTRPRTGDVNLFGAGAAPASGESLRAGVCIYDFADNFMAVYRRELEHMLALEGMDIMILDAQNDQSCQLNQIDTLIAQGYDTLIVNPVQSSSVPVIADMCHGAGVPVVFIISEPEAAEIERWAAEGIRASYVGVEYAQAGWLQGKIIAELPDHGDIDGDGVVSYAMIMGDMANAEARMRTWYATEALAGSGVRVDCLYDGMGDWSYARDRELAADALATHGDGLEVIICNNDDMALGALEAIDATGRTVGEDIYLVGIDGTTWALDAVRQGRMTGTVYNDCAAQADTAARVAFTFANGGEPHTRYTVNYVKVTRDNADGIAGYL